MGALNASLLQFTAASATVGGGIAVAFAELIHVEIDVGQEANGFAVPSSLHIEHADSVVEHMQLMDKDLVKPFWICSSTFARDAGVIVYGLMKEKGEAQEPTAEGKPAVVVLVPAGYAIKQKSVQGLSAPFASVSIFCSNSLTYSKTESSSKFLSLFFAS